MALLAGCSQSAGRKGASSDHQVPIVHAPLAQTPVQVDGHLDEPVWKNARRYDLYAVPAAAKTPRAPLIEHASFLIAWDSTYVYVAMECGDSDIVTESTANGQTQYLLGDVCELFFKTQNGPQYFEFHINPAGYQSVYFWPSRGRRLPGALLAEYPLRVAVQLHGTLNHPEDRDRGWTFEAAIPISLLESHNMHWAPSVQWRLLAARYNYSLQLLDTEYSAFPELPKRDFHQIECFADLVIDSSILP